MIYRNKNLTRVAAGIILTLLFPLFPAAEGSSSREKLIYSKDSLYHRILIYDNGGLRSLRFSVGPQALYQSMIDVNNLDQLQLEFFRLVFAGLLLNPQPEKALFIGLGGGVLPRTFSRLFPDLEMDVVEIDPEIRKVAENFFFFRTGKKIRVHISDGRVFVRRQATKESRPMYDLVVLDAFNSEYVPFHLTTREFLEQVSSLLSPRGVVVANVFHTNRLFDAQLKTFREVYGRCYVFIGTESINAVLLAPGRDLPDLALGKAFAIAEQLQNRCDFGFDLAQVVRKFEPGFQPSPDSKVLTDDLAPVNILRHRSR